MVATEDRPVDTYADGQLSSRQPFSTEVLVRWIGLVLTLCLALAPLGAEAQQKDKVARIGYLAIDGAASNALQEAFIQGLRELGYVEGENVVIEYRSADSRTGRLLRADQVIESPVLDQRGQPTEAEASSGGRTSAELRSGVLARGAKSAAIGGYGGHVRMGIVTDASRPQELGLGPCALLK